MMTGFQFQLMDRCGLTIFAAWFADAELDRRVCAPTEQWFDYVSTRPENFAWLVYEGPQAVGQIQLDTSPDGTGSMSLVVNPELRSRGYGKRILRAFLHHEAASCLGEIEACIEADNVASLRCFRASGFVARDAEPDGNGLMTHVYTHEATPGAAFPSAGL